MMVKTLIFTKLSISPSSRKVESNDTIGRSDGQYALRENLDNVARKIRSTTAYDKGVKFKEVCFIIPQRSFTDTSSRARQRLSYADWSKDAKMLLWLDAQGCRCRRLSL